MKRRVDTAQNKLKLPYGITNNFSQGAIIYHCPHCRAYASDQGDPTQSERAKQIMVSHVLYQHGTYGEKL